MAMIADDTNIHLLPKIRIFNDPPPPPPPPLFHHLYAFLENITFQVQLDLDLEILLQMDYYLFSVVLSKSRIKIMWQDNGSTNGFS